MADLEGVVLHAVKDGIARVAIHRAEPRWIGRQA